MPRLLLISYHFGPRAGTGGFRWTRLAHLLLDRGWKFDVLTHDDIHDGELPDGIRAHHIATPRAARALAWLSGEAPGALIRILRRNRNSKVGGVAAVTGVRETPDPIVPADPRQVVVPVRGQRPALRQRIVRGLAGAAEEIRMLGWGRAAAARGTALAATTRYDAMVVSTPPHATLSAGLRIQAHAGIPLIADFRDP